MQAFKFISGRKRDWTILCFLDDKKDLSKLQKIQKSSQINSEQFNELTILYQNKNIKKMKLLGRPKHQTQYKSLYHYVKTEKGDDTKFV